jgi:protein-S-isoprenylcysteine O-methyltransferase Ste14
VTLFLAQAVLVVWLLLEVALRSGDSAKSWQTSRDDRNTTRLIVFAYFALAVLSIVVRNSFDVDTGSFIAWIGIAFAVAGLVLRVWSMRHLGRFYSRTLRVKEDQRVVDDGPYAYIRNPGYLGSILVWVGSRAAINLVVAAITAVVLAYVYVRRIVAEEALLKASLGQPYESYTEHTWRLIPFIW